MPILVITRPAPAGERFAAALGVGTDVKVVLAPLQRIEAVKTDPLPERIEGVIFTSANGVGQADRFSLLAGLPAWCVGDRTAEAAEGAGFKAISAGGNAENLVDLILAGSSAGPLVHLRGEHVVGGVCARLNAAGIVCAERVVYRQVALTLEMEAAEALAGNDPVVLPLFSPRSTSILARSAPFRAPLHVVAISAAAAEAAGALEPATLRVTRRPSAKEMLSETRSAVLGLTQAGSLEAPPEPG